jgi:hypothetical protein
MNRTEEDVPLARRFGLAEAHPSDIDAAVGRILPSGAGDQVEVAAFNSSI